MHLYGTRVFERQSFTARTVRGQAAAGTRGGAKLRAFAALMLGLMSGMPAGFAQQPAAQARRITWLLKTKTKMHPTCLPRPRP